ncbi:unnamed protein product, partial [Lymnaea stagnalis]
LISDSTRHRIESFILLFAAVPFGALGCCANLINVAVFIRQGIGDCVSFCLLALTVSDFLSIVAGLVFNGAYVLVYVNDLASVDTVALDVVVNHVCAMFYDISQAVIAFVALERCMCVTLPLRFKGMFTFHRAVLVVLGLYAFTIVVYVPHYLTSGLVWSEVPFRNLTRLTLWMSDNRPEVDLYLNSFNHIAMATIYQITVVVSSWLMVLGINRSMKFRERDTSEVGQVTAADRKRKTTLGRGGSVNKTRLKDRSTKTQSVVKTVLCLAIISIVCNAYRLTVVYGRRFNTEFSFLGAYRNTYAVALRLLFFTQTTNASANLVVYYNLNATFRSNLVKTFCPCPKTFEK